MVMLVGRGLTVKSFHIVTPNPKAGRQETREYNQNKKTVSVHMRATASVFNESLDAQVPFSAKVVSQRYSLHLTLSLFFHWHSQYSTTRTCLATVAAPSRRLRHYGCHFRLFQCLDDTVADDLHIDVFEGAPS